MPTEYSRRYAPPMPVLAVRLSVPEQPAAGQPVMALIDTGADVCIVPRILLSQLDAPASEPVWIRGQWSEPIRATRYLIDVHLEQMVIPAVDVVSDPNGREIIIGRNVLEKFRLLLDGPARLTEML